MLNSDCYKAILKTIYLYANKSSGSFKNVIYKCVYKSSGFYVMFTSLQDFMLSSYVYKSTGLMLSTNVFTSLHDFMLCLQVYKILCYQVMFTSLQD